MSEARSLTPLSESDYEAIAAAVMETTRGRWFMTEFAKRNRQADTAQLLTAIQRIERVVGNGSAAASSPDTNLREAAALIGDLRLDLERISGRSNAPSSGLAARLESASASIHAATEAIQDAAWGLREAGADDALCDSLDRRTTEIYAATAIVDGTAQQVGKIADTIAMLDSSLRAFCETTEAHSSASADPAASFGLPLPPAAPLSAYDDIEIVEIDEAPKSLLAEPRRVSARPAAELKAHASLLVEEDVFFEDAMEGQSGIPPVEGVSMASSEAMLREIDTMPAEQKLAYFA